ncbi:MAG: hypothetical protein O2954_09930 [bacterium]|nr:hypothetical protein [bacterium]
MPPFEELPLFIQVVLVASSVLILVVGGGLIRRMIRTAFRGTDGDPK